MREEVVIIFNHGQTNFIIDFIKNNEEPYNDKNLFKVIIADDFGLSNNRLKDLYSNRKDIIFLSRGQTSGLPSHIQQINSLYFGINYLKYEKNHDFNFVHLLDGDDYYVGLDNTPTIFFDDLLKFSLRNEQKSFKTEQFFLIKINLL